MTRSQLKRKHLQYLQRGFTIIELIVVIGVIGIISGISVFGYGAWQQSISENSVKSDLINAASAMESARTFDDAYPQNVLSVFSPSDGVTLEGGGSVNGSSYCIEGTHSSNESIGFYITNVIATDGPEAGTCDDASGGTSCEDAGLFGVFPDCFDYDALPIATSIEGYWTSVPSGYLEENGAAVSRETYSDLFDVINTTFGAGNGSTTFNLPDSRGRVGVNISPTDTEFDTMGEKYGNKTETITTAQLPVHAHDLCLGVNTGATTCDPAYNAIGWGTGSSTQTGTVRASTPSNPVENSRATGGSTSNARLVGTKPSGSGGSHTNIQPSIAKRVAIKYSPATGSDTGLPAGTSIAGYWPSAPSGYLDENGAAVSRSTYSALFSEISTDFGAGNGSTTFNLPDSRGHASVNRDTGDTDFDVIGEKRGAKRDTLTVNQIPAHDHDMCMNSASGSFSCYDQYGVMAFGTGSSSQTGTIRVPLDADTVPNSRATGSTGGNARLTGTRDVGSGESHNTIQPSIVKRYVIKHTAAVAVGSEGPAPGSSIMGYWDSAPTGYLLENGAAVSRTTYANLFAAIGTRFGDGDGSTTFNLPDSRGRIPVALSTSSAEFNTIGQKTGTKAVTLTITQLPAHEHGLCINTSPSSYFCNEDFTALGFGTGSSSQTGSVRVPISSSPVINSRTTGAGNPTVRVLGTQPTGGGLPHNNIQPSIVKNFAIKH